MTAHCPAAQAERSGPTRHPPCPPAYCERMTNPDDRRETPFLDLHPSEWHHEKKREPILGTNGSTFLIYFAVSIPCYWVVSTIVGLIRSSLE